MIRQRRWAEKTRSDYASCETADSAYEEVRDAGATNPRVRKERSRPIKDASGAPDPQRIKRLASITSAAIVVALVAAAYGTWATLSAQKTVEVATANAQPVLVALRDVQAGEVFDSSSIEVRQVPQSVRVQSALGAEALQGGESPVGKQALVDVPSGSQITPVVVAGGSGGGYLSAVLDSEKQAVTIAVDVESGLAGQLRPSDRVRVLALRGDASGEAYLETICENVRVVSLDADRFGSSEAYVSVTVEVDAAQADLVRSAQFAGKVSLVLLSSLDSIAEPLVGAVNEGAPVGGGSA